ncbi:MarR family winged helix-turn-helix transcriptional regulator [Curtobacterium sp. MCBD17_028]|uniref:MarR family winged helix-turn-helix transcriptional regulator n=1 Tax=Curtobacterium sp. MCBD17_028 TaxID=2175670 RepID=UPI000DAAB3EB|nr:MarR family transcriptional regulator [Curtobacterium sp. MCBD17_028]PZE25633.1 MarR family transcriptional regulator [Curtobacterium sp. MCBD17_028]
MASTSATARRAALFDDLVRCETRVYNALTDRLRTDHGIVASQFEMLRYLRAHPDARVGDVARTVAAGIGAISKGVDRLEGRGWVTRVPNPVDGRSSLLRLTGRGAELVAEAERTFDALLDSLLAPVLDDDQVAATGAALAALRRSLEADRIGVPVG